MGSELCLHQMVWSQAARTPDRIAVECRGESLTYSELQKRSMALAKQIRSCGVTPSVRVGLALDRSVEMVVAALAVLSAGGVYVPIDQRFPKDRIDFVLGDAEVSLLLTESSWLTKLPEQELDLILLEGEKAWFQEHPGGEKVELSLGLEEESWEAPEVQPEDLAYMIYTSGSTGRPKGVAIQHWTASNAIHSFQMRPGLCEDDTTFFIASISFDMSVMDIFLTLSTGATLQVVPQEVVEDGNLLKQTLLESKITFFQATPSVFRILLELDWQPSQPLTVVMGGEAVSMELAQGLLERGCRVWNGYGTTETSIYSTLGEITKSTQHVTAGTPLLNTMIYILDEYQRPVSPGEDGEIFIGGAGVSQGYWRRDSLTKERFLLDPFEGEEMRMYRTGDLGRWSFRGELLCLGRLDSQVKLNGFRVELGEIESRLRYHADINDAVVLLREGQLQAFLLLEQGSQLAEEASEELAESCRNHLVPFLPLYMVPSLYKALDALPLSTSGKVDRSALPNIQRVFHPRLAPQSDIQVLVCRWFEEFLQLEGVSLDQDFVRLGGNSLTATRLSSAIRETLHVEFTVAEIFRAGTPEAISEQLVDCLASEQESLPSLERVPRDIPHPLSFGQQRLWFLYQLSPENVDYNISLQFDFYGKLNPDILERALTFLAKQHDTLRTTFAHQEGETVQVVHPPHAYTLPQLNLEELPDLHRHKHMEVQRQAWFREPFDLESGPLWRAQLIKLSPEHWSLWVSLHHILTDGWSDQIFFRSMLDLYQDIEEKGLQDVEPAPFQYVDFVRWQHNLQEGERFDENLAYWKSALEGIPSLIAMPIDFHRPRERSVEAREVSFELSRATYEALEQIAHESGATSYMVLLSAFAAMLYQETGQCDFPIGTFIANRTHADVEGMIGFFANTVVLRLQPQSSLSFREILSQVRTTALDAYNRQDLPFERLVQALKPPRTPDHQPLFQISFVMQEHLQDKATLGEMEVQMTELHHGTSPYDLLVQTWHTESGMAGSFTYRTDLYLPATIQRMSQRFLEVLEEALSRPNASIGAYSNPELECIESALLQCPGVMDAVALRRPTLEGTVETVAYVVSSSDQEEVWATTLRDSLPLETVPQNFVRVSQIPYSSGGCVDRDALERLPVYTEALVTAVGDELLEQEAVESVWVDRAVWSPANLPLHKTDLFPPKRPPTGRVEPKDSKEKSLSERVGEVAYSLREGPALVIPDDAPTTLPEMLRRAAREAPTKGVTNLGMDGSASFLSYPSLLAEAERISAGLAESGSKAGDIVILQFSDNNDFLPALWACFLGGYVVLPMATPPSYAASSAALEKLLQVWEMLDCPLILTTEQTTAELSNLSVSRELATPMRSIGIESLRETKAEEWSGEDSEDPNAVVMFLLTSGSTGLPKAVTHHHRTICSFLEMYKQRHAFGNNEVFLNWLGLDHVAPLFMCHLSGVYNLSSGVNAPFQVFLEDPLVCLDWMDTYRATSTFLPNFAFGLVNEHADRVALGNWDLSCLSVAANGGEMIVPRTARRFVEILEPFGVSPSAMVPIWGMSETSSATITWLDFSLETVKDEDPFVPIGDPVPGFAMRIVDDNQVLLPEGQEGRLQVKGASCLSEYYKRPEANAESFTEDGWFDTGDLAFIDERGLTMTGRLKDVIIIAGTNYYNHEIEAVVQSVSGVMQSFALACAVRPNGAETDQVAVFFCPTNTGKQDLPSLIRKIRSAVTLQNGVIPSFVLPVETSDIPKTEIGKLQRSKMQSAFAAGRFEGLIRDVDLQTRNDQTLPNWSVERVWTQRALPVPVGATTHTALVISEDTDLVNSLRLQGHSIFHAMPGPSFEKIGKYDFVFSPKESEHYSQLMESLPGPMAVVHLLACCPTTDLEKAIECGIASVLFSLQAIHQTWADSTRFVVASIAAPEIPWRWSEIPGLLASVSHEMPLISARTLHLDQGSYASMPEWLWGEVCCPKRATQEVLYRAGKRSIHQLKPVEWNKEKIQPLPFDSGDFLLITGGLGGIGRALVTWLLSHHSVRLLLVGRSQASIEDLSERAATSGSVCVYESLDVQDTSSLERTVQKYEDKWNTTLKGVFHLAHSLRDVLLVRERIEELTSGLGAKLWGTFGIAKMLRQRPGAFLVDFGTINEWAGGFSAGGYGAFARIGEGVCEQLREEGIPAYHLIWSRWDKVGMTRHLAVGGQTRARGQLPISTHQGLETLIAFLHRPPCTAAIGLDLQHPMIRKDLRKDPLATHFVQAFVTPQPESVTELREPSITDRFGTSCRVEVRVVAELPKTQLLPEIRSEGLTPSTASSPMEADLVNLWRELLALEHVGVDDNFFDLGGHSLLLAKLQEQIERELGVAVAILDFFRYPTIRTLAASLGESAKPTVKVEDYDLSVRKKEAQKQQTSHSPALPQSSTLDLLDDPSYDNAIAIVGMAGRFPGAANLEEYWSNLVGGVETLQTFSEEELLAAGVPQAVFSNRGFVPVRGALDDVKSFDASFFGITPTQAKLMDPQHRIFIECAWASLEDASYNPLEYSGDIGIFAGCSVNTYMINNLLSDRQRLARMGWLQGLLGSDKDHLSTLTAYKLNLRGPAVTVQTACSTSLVALEMACRSLADGHCDIALAGASSVTVPYIGGHRFQPGHVFSRDGHCRPFDSEASGTLSGDGVGVVVLRRLKDAVASRDSIRAVIRGVAINNDGNQKIGYTAPSVAAQSEVIVKALERADVHPDTIGAVEAHGTGTALGDPVEVAALTQAFAKQTQRKSYCALGSVKGNLGHLNTAAGIASLIKMVLALEHKVLPPSLHCNIPHPDIDFPNTPFFVNSQARSWEAKGHPRRAGVSSLGAGGTNAHVVLEEATLPEDSTSGNHTDTSDEAQVLFLSAQTPEALKRLTERLGRYLWHHPELRLADVAYSLQQGRHPWAYRRAILANSTSEAALLLSSNDPTQWVSGHTRGQSHRSLAFLFPAQGTQKLRMGKALYLSNSVFRESMDRCFQIVDTHLGFSLKEILFSNDGSSEHEKDMDNQRIAGPSMLAVSYSLAKMWMSQGVSPSALLGHSTGEYAAACLAGIFSLEDAFQLFMERARLFETAPRGGGLFVSMSPQELEDYLPSDCYVSLINGPRACVVCGPTKVISALQAKLEQAEIHCRNVRISRPAHCPLLAPLVEPLREAAHRIKYSTPKVPMLSCVTGKWLSKEEAVDPEYWVKHLIQPVQFASAMNTLAQEGPSLLLELGPSRSLSAMVKMNWSHCTVVPSLAPVDSSAYEEPHMAQAFVLQGKAQIWTEGGARSWPPQGLKGRRVSLPTYPFVREEHWVEMKPGTIPSMANLGEDNALGETAQDSAGAAYLPNLTPSTLPKSPALSASPPPVLERHPRPALVIPYAPPENLAQAILSDLCAELFGLERVGIYDEFITLGADSLIGVRLLNQLYQRYGFELHQKALFRSVCVAQMAAYIDSDALELWRQNNPLLASALMGEDKATEQPLEVRDSSMVSEPRDWVNPADSRNTADFYHSSERNRLILELPEELEDVIVPLKVHGTRPPLFLAHPAAGVIFPYYNLARLLGDDQPVFALQASGITGTESYDTTCEEQASRYITAMRYVQPQGPYMIAGFSYGSYVSYEIAQQLKGHGEEVAFLGLIDELVPIDGLRTRVSDLARLFMGRSLVTFSEHFKDYLYLRTEENESQRNTIRRKKRSKRRIPSLGKFRDWLQHSTMAALLPKESHLLMLHQPAMRQMFELFLLHCWNSFSYSPGPYRGDATVFLSPWTAEVWRKRKGGGNALGWERLITGELDVRLCSGDHLGMIREPHVGVLAAELRNAIDKALNSNNRKIESTSYAPVEVSN